MSNGMGLSIGGWLEAGGMRFSIRGDLVPVCASARYSARVRHQVKWQRLRIGIEPAAPIGLGTSGPAAVQLKSRYSRRLKTTSPIASNSATETRSAICAKSPETGRNISRVGMPIDPSPISEPAS